MHCSASFPPFSVRRRAGMRRFWRSRAQIIHLGAALTIKVLYFLKKPATLSLAALAVSWAFW